MNKKTIVLGLASSLILMAAADIPSVYATITDDVAIGMEEVNKDNITFSTDVDINEIDESYMDYFTKLEISYSNEGKFILQMPESKVYEIIIDENSSIETLDNNQLSILLTEENSSMEFILNNTTINEEYRVTITIQVIDGNVKFQIDSITKEETEVVEEPQNDTSTDDTIEDTIEDTKEEIVNESEEESESDEVEISEEEPVEEAGESDEVIVEDAVEQEKIVESKGEIQSQPMLMMAAISAKEPTLENGFYTVQPGDTFNKIAGKLGLSTLQLRVYNPQITNINIITVGSKLAATREAVESRLSPEEKAHLYKGNGSSQFKTPSEFFQYLFPFARELANAPGEERLYVSIMLAQAALESGYGKSALASPPYNNLTGIKRKGNEDYVKMWTREETKDKESFYVLADFKVFPTYYDALKGNADLIRYRGFYDEVWVKNSPTYQDAVIALDKSPYATDNAYGSKIARIIRDYNLNQYDFDTILSTESTNYFADVKHNNSGIYTLPKFVNGAILYTSHKFNGETVRVTEEATTESGVFSKLVRLTDNSTIGWIKKADLLTYTPILSTVPTDYYGTVLPNNRGIYTHPKGTYGAILYTSYKYNNKNVRVVEEATTKDGVFVKINDINDGRTVGWINKSDLSEYDKILDQRSVEYYGHVRANNDGIYTNPKGTLGSTLYTSYKYNWKNVKIVEEVTTINGTFARIVTDNNKHTIGWIKKSDLAIYDSKSTAFYAQVHPNNGGIFTAPEPITGKVLYTTYKFNWKTVFVSDEVTIAGKTYAKLSRVNDNSQIGWIKRSDLVAYTTIQSSMKTNYVAQVNGSNSGIYTLPKGSYGAKLYTSYKFNWKDVRVVEEAQTQNDTYAKIVRMEDGSFIGWINKSDLNF